MATGRFLAAHLERPVCGSELVRVDLRGRPNAIAAPNDSAWRVHLIQGASAFRVAKHLKEVIEQA